MKRTNINNLLSNPKLLSEFYNDMRLGAVAVVPTDTVYGFAVAADSPQAVEKIYKIKGRHDKKPLILFIKDPKDLYLLQIKVPPKAQSIIDKYFPGALTLIFAYTQSKQLSAFSFGTIGVRQPNHPALLEILKKTETFFLTTSANRSNTDTVSDSNKIADEFSNEIDWLIDEGILHNSLPSTIIDFSKEPPRLLRQGVLEISP